MANAFISEYAETRKDESGDNVPVANEPAIAEQQVTFTTSNPSAAFQEGTKFVRVVCDAKAHFKISASPVATANSPYLPADSPEYFGVRKELKIAFYDGSS